MVIYSLLVSELGSLLYQILRKEEFSATGAGKPEGFLQSMAMEKVERNFPRVL